MPQPALSARLSWALALLCGLLLFPVPARAASFEHLGQFPGAAVPTSEAWSVSGSGALVAGHAINSLGNYEAYFWSGGALTPLSALGPGGESFAWGVSGDGSTIVGRLDTGAGFPEAFLWTPGGGYTMLGILGTGAISSACAVNADGTVVVGMSESAAGVYEAFRWTAGGGMVSLGDLPGGGSDGQANGVSADGTIVVGRGLAGAGYEAFRWTAGTGMVGLGSLMAGGESDALGISADGSTIVGGTDVALGVIHAYRWTAGAGMVDLGALPGSSASMAYAVNADGSVVVGSSSMGGTNEAFLWTQTGGLVSLAGYLQLRGVSLAGWNLDTATAVSADGVTIVGLAFNPSGDPEAFVARTTGGLSTLEALADSLQALAGITNRAAVTGLSRARTMITSAPGPRLGPAGLSGGDGTGVRRRFWTAGTVLSDSSLAGSDLGADSGAGLTWTWDSGASAGAGMFAGKRATDTSHGGSQDLTMTGPAAYVGYAPGPDGLRAEAATVLTLVDLDLERGYVNGAGSATSSGQTQGRMLTLAARLGWLFPVTEAAGLEPFAMHSWQILDLDGYTEDNGPFPARFDSRQDVANITRLGLEGRYAWDETTDLWTWLAWNHRWEDSASAMSGALLGLSDFRFGSVRVDQDWGDTGLGARHRPWEGFEVFSRLGLGIDSEDQAEPDLSLTFGLAWDI